MGRGFEGIIKVGGISARNKMDNTYKNREGQGFLKNSHNIIKVIPIEKKNEKFTR